MEPPADTATNHEQVREPQPALKTEDPLFSPSSMSGCLEGDSPLGPPTEVSTKPEQEREPPSAPEPAVASASVMPPPSLELKGLDRALKEEPLGEPLAAEIADQAREPTRRREAPTRTRAHSTVEGGARKNRGERHNRMTVSMSVRRNRSRPVSPDYRTNLSHDRRKLISKALTDVLRHKADRYGLAIRPDGYFDLEAVLSTGKFRREHVLRREVLQVVQESDKQRFEIGYINDKEMIRATQGHSLQVDKDLIQNRLSQDELPITLYHGTYSSCYRSIARNGLMAGGPHRSRTDIHLIQTLPGTGAVISGMRTDCDIALVISPQAAAEAGCIFYRSSNEVYLTEGLEGTLPPEFIRAVIIIETREMITSESTTTAHLGVPSVKDFCVPSSYI